MRNKRMSNVTIDGLYMLKAFADGETDFDKALRDAIIEAGARRRMTKWATKADVSQGTISHYARTPEQSITLLTALKLVEAAGLRVTVEVDE